MRRNSNKKCKKKVFIKKKKFKKKFWSDWKGIKLLEELQDHKQEVKWVIKHRVILKYQIWILKQLQIKSQIITKWRRKKSEIELLDLKKLNSVWIFDTQLLSNNHKVDFFKILIFLWEIQIWWFFGDFLFRLKTIISCKLC